MKMLQYILVFPFVSSGAKSCLEDPSELKRDWMPDMSIFLCDGLFIWIAIFFLQLRRKV
jgi:hypothetical protein